MKILLWAPQGSGTHYWGPGISAYNLYSSRKNRKDFTISLAHGLKKQEKYGLFENQFFISNLGDFGILSSLFFLLRAKLWIMKNAHKFDVVHVLDAYETSFRPAIWFKKRGVKVFCKITTYGGGIIDNSIISRTLGLGKNRVRNLNKIDGYISISSQITSMLKENNVNNRLIHNIPNGVNTDRFHPVSSEEKFFLRSKYGLENIFTILFVGGISPRKQPSLLLEAYIHFIETYNITDTQIIFLGPIRESEIEMEKMIHLKQKTKFKQSIIFIDQNDKPEVYYQMANVFCLPSKREGMSNALLEAMSCGLASIVTPISGSTDLIEHNVNGLYTQDNVSNLCEQLKRLYFDKGMAHQFGVFSRNKILESYSVDVILRKHLELFQNS